MTPRDEITSIGMLLSARGLEVSDADIALALVEIDRAVLNAASSLRWELWDGVTPINGVKPEALSSVQGVGGAAYVIYDGPKAILFQPYRPGAEGYQSMTVAEATKAAQQQIAESSARLIFDRLVDEVERKVRATQ